MTVRASAAKEPEPAPKRRGSYLWVQGLACGALLTFAAPTALLLGVLLAPALVCLLADDGPDRSLPRAVALACAAASLNPLWQLWMGNDRLELALASLSSPLTLLLAWGAGACAWALCQVLPVVVHGLWEFQEAARARAIEAELARFREEWRLDELPGK